MPSALSRPHYPRRLSARHPAPEECCHSRAQKNTAAAPTGSTQCAPLASESAVATAHLRWRAGQWAGVMHRVITSGDEPRVATIKQPPPVPASASAKPLANPSRLL